MLPLDGAHRAASSIARRKAWPLARGFDRYDDDLPERGVERSAAQTTDRALALLKESGAASPGAMSASAAPLFVWVHYFDPHTPYAPAEPYRAQYAKQPYLGEVAAMDAQLGRLASHELSRAEAQHNVAHAVGNDLRKPS